MPFRLWPAQVSLLWALLTNRLVLILKARQLGISWICCWYALWLCFWQPGKFVLLLSRGQDEANEMLRRVKVLYQRLPEWMRQCGPQVTKLNTEEIAWDNESRIQSLPASPGSGRSFTASLAIMDEAAFMQYATEVYTALKPTVDGGGSLIVLSTAKGKTNLFYDMCQRAMEGTGQFVFRFLPWQSRPGRDAAWYAAVEADAVDSSLMKQEYPASADEAFEATEVDTFLPDMTLWDACREDLSPLDGHTPCILALDGAESNDTFASLLVSAHPLDAARLAVRYVRPYVPQKGIPLDFNEIEIDLRELGQAHAIMQLAYDPFLLGQLIMRLKKPATLYRAVDTDKAHPLVFPAFPAPCEPFHQGPDRLVADKGLYDEITTRMLAHDGNAALRAHISNANRKVDSESRKLRIVKRTYALKIDLAVCLSMACQRAREVIGLPSGADLMGFLP